MGSATQSSNRQALWVRGRLPGLNEIIDARGRRSATEYRWDGYNALKKRWADQIVLAARQQDFKATKGGRFTYLFVEPNQRRDPSNIAGGGIKIIEDALVGAELLPNDGWKCIATIRPYWTVRPEAVGALVVVDPKRALKFEEMIELAERIWRS